MLSRYSVLACLLLHLVPLVTMWSFALIGAVDDWEGIRGPRRGLGMSARMKFTLQAIIALVIAYGLKEVLIVPTFFGLLHRSR